MKNNKPVKVDKKEKLLERLKGIQSKIDDLENQRSVKIIKLAKKFNLFDLSDKTIESEFSLIKAKYASVANDDESIDNGKKN